MITLEEWMDLLWPIQTTVRGELIAPPTLHIASRSAEVPHCCPMIDQGCALGGCRTSGTGGQPPQGGEAGPAATRDLGCCRLDAPSVLQVAPRLLRLIMP